MKQRRIQIRFTGQTGQVDGYMEFILGALAMGGVLIHHTMGKKLRPGDTTQIYLDLLLKAPPIGDQGELDIPLYTGDNE